MLTHLAKSVKGRFRQRPGPFYSVFKERCSSLLDSPAALIRYLIGHRLAFVHGNAEVCLPSNWVRKRGKVAGKEATARGFFLGPPRPPTGRFFCFCFRKAWKFLVFSDNPTLFLPERRSGPHPFWSFRRIFKIRRKTRKKVPHGGILHLLFCRGFVMIKALYCEKCDNTTIARSSI